VRWPLLCSRVEQYCGQNNTMMCNSEYHSYCISRYHNTIYAMLYVNCYMCNCVTVMCCMYVCCCVLYVCVLLCVLCCGYVLCVVCINVYVLFQSCNHLVKTYTQPHTEALTATCVVVAYECCIWVSHLRAP